MVHFDLDPPLSKVVIIGLLEFGMAIVGAILLLLQQEHEPTTTQILIAVLIAVMQLLTFFATFVKTGETPATYPAKPPEDSPITEQTIEHRPHIFSKL